MPSSNDMTFTTLLASLIHDMKNGLGIITTELEEMSAEAELQCPAWQSRVTQLQHESSRLHTRLIQLLTFYKTSQPNYHITIDEYPLAPLLEERYLLHKPLLDSRGIECTIECPPTLVGYCDRELIAGAIDNALDNAIRHTTDQIRLGATDGNGWLVVEVADNGPGISRPGRISTTEGPGETRFSSGSTGLGLYFCALVAQLHINDGRAGYIELKNDTRLGGGCMRLFLP